MFVWGFCLRACYVAWSIGKSLIICVNWNTRTCSWLIGISSFRSCNGWEGWLNGWVHGALSFLMKH